MEANKNEVHFVFLSKGDHAVIDEIDTDMPSPIRGQYVWLNGGIRFQVTAVHFDYVNRVVKIYCAQ